MISPLAITLALAFWAPYNHGQPVCPDGVQITYEATQLGVDSGWVDERGDNCRMHIRDDIAGQSIPYQCMIVAHELGHAWFGLPDSTEPGSIMTGPLTIPGACYPTTPRKGQTGSLVTTTGSGRHARWTALRAQRWISARATPIQRPATR